IESENWRTGLNAAWDPDLFGAVRAEGASAEAALRASRAQLWAARQNALATAIEAYLDITYLREAIRLNLTRIDLLSERAAATERRYRGGLASSFELYGVRAQRRGAEAQLPQLEARLTRAEAALALAMGRYAEHIDAVLAEPFRPRLDLEPPLADAPVALLVQRPDVLAAAEQLEAARLEVGAARAALFPQLRFSAVLGTQGPDAEGALDPENWFAQLTGALTQPIFQGGALRAQVRGAEARYAAAAAEFARTALSAYGDAESAFGAFEESRQRYVFLADQTQEARATVRLQAERYAAGLSDYAAYLDARGDAVGAELSLAQAARDLAGARLAVYRALGGGWARSPEAPADAASLIERLLGPGDAA
ncbi:TolC family protein, partial [Phenylobacterium sp.]|uniref:TolC family protein n=1 Tax=Phenylobacterium sp. TaxID=1871053 RepID=UPI0019999AC6